MIVVGLDLSLTGSAVVRVNHLRIVDHARFSSDTAGQRVPARSERLRTLSRLIVHRATAATPVDLALVEQPSYGSPTSGSLHDRSGLWWLVIARLTALGIPVAEVPPSTLKMYALGKGGGKDTGKDAVLSAVIRRYGDLVPELRTNDEADGLVLAAMAARRLGSPIEGSLPETHKRAMRTVLWPDATEKGAMQ